MAANVSARSQAEWDAEGFANAIVLSSDEDDAPPAPPPNTIVLSSDEDETPPAPPRPGPAPGSSAPGSSAPGSSAPGSSAGGAASISSHDGEDVKNGAAMHGEHLENAETSGKRPVSAAYAGDEGIIEKLPPPALRPPLLIVSC